MSNKTIRNHNRIFVLMLIVLIVGAILMDCTQAKAQDQCNAPSQTAMITGINMDDSGTYQITLEDKETGNVYLLQGALLKIAQNAGRLLGQTVTWQGQIDKSSNDCKVNFVSNWSYSWSVNQ